MRELPGAVRFPCIPLTGTPHACAHANTHTRTPPPPPPPPSPPLPGPHTKAGNERRQNMGSAVQRQRGGDVRELPGAVRSPRIPLTGTAHACTHANTHTHAHHLHHHHHCRPSPARTPRPGTRGDRTRAAPVGGRGVVACGSLLARPVAPTFPLLIPRTHLRTHARKPKHTHTHTHHCPPTPKAPLDAAAGKGKTQKRKVPGHTRTVPRQQGGSVWSCGGHEVKTNCQKECEGCKLAWQAVRKSVELKGVGHKKRKKMRTKMVARPKMKCSACGYLCKRRGRKHGQRNCMLTYPMHRM